MDHADNGHHPPFYSISDRSLQDVQIYGHNSPTGFAEHTFPFGYAQQISTDLESHSVQSEGPLDLRMMPISHLAGTKSIALASSRPQIERQDSHLSVESVSSQQHDHVSTLLQQPAPPSKRVIRSSKHVGGNMHTQCREETRTSSDNVLEHRMEGENHWRMPPKCPRQCMILTTQQIELSCTMQFMLSYCEGLSSSHTTVSLPRLRRPSHSDYRQMSHRPKG